MTIQIEPIQLVHVEQFHAVLDAVASERKYLPVFRAPSLEQMHTFVEHTIATEQPQFVALHKGRVVGWCDILARSDPIREHVGTVGMGLLHDYRGKAIGRRLLVRTLEAANSFGFRRIELKVRASNAAAIGLYNSLGFTEEGRLKDDVLIDGAFDSTVCMAFFPS